MKYSLILTLPFYSRPAVENSNRASAAFARIFKELILPTTPGKPLPRTPKGTIAHKAAVNLYTDEIAALYAEVDKAKGDDVTPPKTWGEPDIAEWLGENLKALLERDVDATKDLFDQGADRYVACSRILRTISNTPCIV